MSVNIISGREKLTRGRGTCLNYGRGKSERRNALSKKQTAFVSCRNDTDDLMHYSLPKFKQAKFDNLDLMSCRDSWKSDLLFLGLAFEC